MSSSSNSFASLPGETGDIDVQDNTVIPDNLTDDVAPEDLAALNLGEPGSSDQESSGAGGYRFDSPQQRQELKDQRTALWKWVKSLGSNLLKEGINLTKVSLPVILFEPRSFLQRLSSNWEYMDLLNAAAVCTNPVERMKLVVGFALGGLCRQVSFHKPFNPILGETYQAKYPNGTMVYCEQISHHPPVSSWQVVDPSGKFVFSGSGNWSASSRGNSLKGRQSGMNCIKFKSDGAEICYELPTIIIKGVLFGDRVLKYQGEVKFTDEKNGLVCDIEIDCSPKPGFMTSFFTSKKNAYKPDMIKGTLKQGEKVIDSCTGNWLTHLEWEGGVSMSRGVIKRVWDAKTSPVTVCEPIEDALLSDSRHRNDLIYLAKQDLDLAQEWKHKLEEAQRHDRKLRKEGGGYCEGH